MISRLHLEIDGVRVSATGSLRTVILVPLHSKIVGETVHKSLLEIRMALILFLGHEPIIRHALILQFWLNLRRQLLYLQDAFFVLLLKVVQVRYVAVLRLEVQHVQRVTRFDPEVRELLV